MLESLSGRTTERVEVQLKALISLPYVHGVSEALKRVLKPIGARTVMKPNQTIMKKLVHPKDVVPDIERSNVVYRIPCVTCHATYVGETKMKLGKRVDQHRKAVQRAEVEVSALAEHVWKFDHKVDWGHAAILDCNSNLHERLTLEACHIRRQSLPLNRDRSVLSREYDHLLKSSQ